MADVLFLGVLVVFFAGCSVFVRLCDRMIERSDVVAAEGPNAPGTGEPAPVQVAA